MSFSSRLFRGTLPASLFVSACAGSPGASPVAAFDGGGTPDAVAGLDGRATPDAAADGSAHVREGGVDGGTEAAPSGDAAVMRNPTCTPVHQQTGTAVDSKHGRLDGTLVYVVDVGADPQCNGDDSHVHLQIDVGGAVYDVAVDIGTAPNDEVGSFMETLAVPGGAWSEGWHSADDLGYPALGVHDPSFTTMSPMANGAALEALLAHTSKVSIFCTGYAQGNGCHDVHYEDGETRDGAIVLDPTATMSPVLFFRFATQTF